MTQRSKDYLSLVLFFGLIVITLSQTPPILEYGYITFSGNITGESIAYQEELQIIQNVQNPVLVYVNYDSGNEDAYVCLNSYQGTFPVSGVNLQYSCPNGGFGIISNQTNTPSTSQFKRSRVLSKERQERFAKLVEDVSTSENAEVYVKPSKEAGFVVTIPSLSDDTTMNFNIYVTASYCEDSTTFPVGDGGTCVQIANLTSSGEVISIPANGWSYYRYFVGEFNTSTVNSITFAQNNTKKIEMFVQSGYYPTDTWYLETDVEEDDDGNEYQTIYTPSRNTDNSFEVFYVGLYNTDSSNSQYVNVSVSTSGCSPNNISIDCTVDVTLNDPVSGIYLLSANMSSPNSSASFDYSDAEAYENSFAYFLIQDLPTDIGDDYFVRVSVGNNNLGKFDYPPALYAKLNGYPSLESHDYNISNNADSVANQLSLPVRDLSDQWYVLVQLPSSFTIWVGNNCHGNCVGGKGDGSCTCSFEGVVTPCNYTSPTNGTISQYYTIPTNLEDSSGVCTCSENSYSKSFDCSQKPDYHIPYLILLLLIGIVIIVIAIAVPVYRYIKRQKTSYDTL